MRGFIVREQVKSLSGWGGYLLLEVMLAIGMAGLLMGLIFTICTGSLSLANLVVSEGRAKAEEESLLTFMEESFQTLPGNAVLDLQTTETLDRFLPRLTVQNAPASFSFAGQPISAQAVVLTTTPSASGGINLILEYYSEPLLDAEDAVGEDRQEPIGSLVLYRDIWRFQVLAYDQRTQEWTDTWEVRGRQPLQLEINVVFGPQREEVIHYLWLPPKVSPATLVRSIGQGNAGNDAGGNNTGGNAAGAEGGQ